MKISNIENIYVNGRKATIFSKYELDGNVWVFVGNDYINGWFKRESTILRKITNE